MLTVLTKRHLIYVGPWAGSARLESPLSRGHAIRNIFKGPFKMWLIRVLYRHFLFDNSLGLVCSTEYCHPLWLWFSRIMPMHMCTSHSHSLQTRTWTLILMKCYSGSGREMARYYYCVATTGAGSAEGEQRQSLARSLMDKGCLHCKGQLHRTGITGRAL